MKRLSSSLAESPRKVLSGTGDHFRAFQGTAARGRAYMLFTYFRGTSEHASHQNGDGVHFVSSLVHIRNATEVTNALPISWTGTGFRMEEEWAVKRGMEWWRGSGPPKLSLTGRKETARLYHKQKYKLLLTIG
ncbi:hypothetical protein EVAR_30783_1 [Eumeta japonica]|uniref:Uncharacterized protein n=1 Tax=Eumeta variegata TaxID=151549 RepID=A0A4C1V6H0_EUMVA|nr:hypothetical protein EVAR_30783_1 [Eumeta japonica]